MDDDVPFACDICGVVVSDDEVRCIVVPPLGLIDEPLPPPTNVEVYRSKGYWLATLCPSCNERTKDQRLATLGGKIATVPGAEAQ